MLSAVRGARLQPLAGRPLIPLASGPVWRGAAFLMVSQLIGDCAMVIFMTNEISFRQQVTPEERLGRVNAAMQILSRGVLPISALAGGIIAGITGIRGAMAIAVAGNLAVERVAVEPAPRRTPPMSPTRRTRLSTSGRGAVGLAILEFFSCFCCKNRCA